MDRSLPMDRGPRDDPALGVIASHVSARPCGGMPALTDEPPMLRTSVRPCGLLLPVAASSGMIPVAVLQTQVFPTGGSHLEVVALLPSTAISMDVMPQTRTIRDQDQVISTARGVLIPTGGPGRREPGGGLGLRTALLAACRAAALGGGALLGLIGPDQRPHRPVGRPPAWRGRRRPG
ncbi:hypothetical protein R6Z07M_013792 [Ovis aries]